MILKVISRDEAISGKNYHYNRHMQAWRCDGYQTLLQDQYLGLEGETAFATCLDGDYYEKLECLSRDSNGGLHSTVIDVPGWAVEVK